MMEGTILSYEEQVTFALRELYAAGGYTPFRMSRFEEYDLYVRNKAFLVSDRVITFTDTDGKLMALKPDVTLSIVKNCRPPRGGTAKLYYDENVFRVSEGTHAFREIKQAGLECIGEVDAAAVAEVLSLALASLAVIDRRYVLDVSHLGVVDAAIRPLGVEEEVRGRLLAALGSKNPHGLRAILADAGVSEERAAALLALLVLEGAPAEVLPRLEALFPEGSEGRGAVAEFAAVLSLLPADAPLRVDFSVTHDMRYYNGIVFRGFVPSVASGILSGGQYDRLVAKLGRATGAIGFALYLDLLEGAKTAVPKEKDILLLYKEGDEPRAVLRCAERIRKEGRRVQLGRAVPEDGAFEVRVFGKDMDCE